ncbi:MAG: GTP-binding protein [Pseudomonadota bacterium]
MAPIPVTIVTGFLGAGKTTLVNELLRDPAFAETALLINEFGDVQIDHDLIAEHSDEMVMTTTGCLCCTASSDINLSLGDLCRKRDEGSIGPVRRVIVETTGLADPVPIIAALLGHPWNDSTGEILSEQYVLARMITLFDTVNGPETLDRYVEALRQVALSDAVLLTKSDLLSATSRGDDVAKCRQRIAAINPSAPILDRHADWPSVRNLMLEKGTYDLRGKGDDAIAWLNAERIHSSEPQGHTHHRHEHEHARDHGHHHHTPEDAHHHHDTNRHGDDIQSNVIFLDEPVSPATFSLFLEMLRSIPGRDLLRLKGLVALSDDPYRPLVVHGVQNLIHLVDRLEAWPSEDQRTRIVTIGRDLNVDALRTVLVEGERAQR